MLCITLTTKYFRASNLVLGSVWGFHQHPTAAYFACDYRTGSHFTIYDPVGAYCGDEPRAYFRWPPSALCDAPSVYALPNCSFFSVAVDGRNSLNWANSFKALLSTINLHLLLSSSWRLVTGMAIFKPTTHGLFCSLVPMPSLHYIHFCSFMSQFTRVTKLLVKSHCSNVVQWSVQLHFIWSEGSLLLSPSTGITREVPSTHK